MLFGVQDEKARPLNKNPDVFSGAKISSPPSRLSIPINWSMTRSKFETKGTATTSASYQENWVLERVEGNRLELRSPRASVGVTAARENEAPTGTPASIGSVNFPQRLNISEFDFARLIGAVQTTGSETKGTASGVLEDLKNKRVTFNLQNTPNHTDHVVLNLFSEEHCEVQFQIMSR